MSEQSNIDNLIGGVSVFNLALNVAGIILNKKNVAIYDNTGKTEKFVGSLFGDSKTGKFVTNLINQNNVIISAEVRKTAKLIEHPLENGKVRADNKVIMPTEIDIKMTLPYLDYQDILNEINNGRENNEMFCIKVKGENYFNMQITDIPMTITAENVNKLTFVVRFKQVLLSKNQKDKVANVDDSDTQSTGLKTGVFTTLSNFII